MENKILCCNGCHVRVHMLCYGVKTYKNKWKCSPCVAESSDPYCKLCLQYGGAFKKTSNGHWAHVVCGLFIEGVNFGSKVRMEPINISNIPEKCYNKLCEFCFNSDGVCCSCSYSNCDKWVHVTCAQRSNCLKELLDEKNKIKFLAYCENHVPSKRRISSVFVRDKLNEMDDELQQQPAIEPVAESSNESEQASECVELADTDDKLQHEPATETIDESSNVSEQSNECDELANELVTRGDENESQHITNASELSNGNNDDYANAFSNATLDNNDAEIDISNLSVMRSSNRVEDDSTNESNNSQFWWDYRDLLHQLDLKDQEIAKVSR